MATKLTKKEKDVLKHIVTNGRMTDTAISKKMPITQQAVHQIRKRLENNNIISNYLPIVNFKKIGLEIFYLINIHFKSKVWKKFSEEQLNKKLLKIPYLFLAFRIPSSDTSYVLIFGFKNIHEQEEFEKKLETTFSNEIKINWAHTSSVNNMLGYSNLNLVNYLLGKEKSVDKITSDFLKKS